MGKEEKKDMFVLESVACALVIKDMISICKNFINEHPNVSCEGYLEAAFNTMELIDDSATKLLKQVSKEYVKEVEKKLNEERRKLYS